MTDTHAYNALPRAGFCPSYAESCLVVICGAWMLGTDLDSDIGEVGTWTLVTCCADAVSLLSPCCLCFQGVGFSFHLIFVIYISGFRF